MNGSSQSSNPFNLLISPDLASSMGCHSPVGMCLSGTPAPRCTSSCPPSQSSQELNGHCHKEFRNNGQDLSLSENECCYDVNIPDVDSLLECTFSYTKIGHVPTELLAGPNLQTSPNGNLVYAANSPENPADYSSENLPWLGNSNEQELCVSSDEDDIYAHVVPPSRNSCSADTLQTSHCQTSRIKKLVDEESNLHKSDLVYHNASHLYVNDLTSIISKIVQIWIDNS